MKKWTLLGFLLCFLFFIEAEAAQIQWYTNYNQAVSDAKSANKPIILFFTGSDWCGWCNKLEREVFESKDFIDSTAQKMVFVKLDFPMRSQLPDNQKQQNELLKDKYSIRSYPTLIVIDPQERQIGITGYRPGGGKQYADHLMKMVNEYTAYREKLSLLDTGRLRGKELKRMYQKANELNLDHDVNRILAAGMKSDQKQYFMTERYRALAGEGQARGEEAVALKKQLLADDVENLHLTHYQVAVIDFETCCDECVAESHTGDELVAPLVKYIRKFGNEDRENLWRLQMVISQVYLDKNEYEKALDYARSSYKTAPSSIKPDIAVAIENIEKIADLD